MSIRQCDWPVDMSDGRRIFSPPEEARLRARRQDELLRFGVDKSSVRSPVGLAHHVGAALARSRGIFELLGTATR